MTRNGTFDGTWFEGPGRAEGGRGEATPTPGAVALRASAPRGPAARLGLVLLAVAAILACLGRPTAAQAHVELLGSSPAQGQRVSLDLDRVTLQFEEELLAVGNAIAVRGPDGHQVTVGPVVARGRDVGVRLALTAPGRHTLTYRVVGEDGHSVTGTLWFTVAAGAPARAASGRTTSGAEPSQDRAQPTADRPDAATASPAEAAASDPGGSGTPWVLPALAVGFVALLGYGGRRRRS